MYLLDLAVVRDSSWLLGNGFSHFNELSMIQDVENGKFCF